MPTLGLCVIAKNAAPTLPACLASVEGLVDAMVMVDTGSVDATAEIAERSGATVVKFQWCDDFSAARNAALAAIHTDWVLVLDADEELDRAAHDWIRNELKAPHADGYVTPVRNYMKPWDQPLTGVVAIPCGERHPQAPHATDYVHSEVCRLYRRHPDIYYVGHVHEQVEYRMLQLGRPLGKAGFFIHHFGWYLIDEEGMQRKRKVYHDLLAKKVQQCPDDPQVLLQYGDALCVWSGKIREGLAYFMKAAALASENKSVWMYIAAALLQLEQLEAVLIAIEQVPADAQYAGKRAQIKGEALGALKRWEEACLAYREALHHCPNSISIRAKLALVEREAGYREQGMARMREAIAAAEAVASAHSHAHPYLYAAELHAQIRQWPKALVMVRAGLVLDPAFLPLHEMHVRAAVATGQLAEAAEAAARIVELCPSPRAVLRSVAILNQIGNQHDAYSAIKFGLMLFPMSDELQQAQRELETTSAMLELDNIATQNSMCAVDAAIL